MPVANDLNQQYDRITEMLRQQSTPAMPAQSDYEALALGNLYNPGQFAQGAVQLEQSARDQGMQKEMNILKVFEAKKAAGDAQAKALDDKIQLFTGGDPEGTALFLQALHEDPEPIDPGNSYQVLTKLAGIKKRTGYESPALQMRKELDDLELQGKRLSVQKTQAEIGKIGADARKAEAEANAPMLPFEGKALDAQMLNVLLTGDPSSPVYRASYAQMAQPKVTVDPMTGTVTRVSPDMSAFRPPASGATPIPAPQADMPVGLDPLEGFRSMPTSTAAPTSKVEVIEGTGATREDRKTLKKAEVEAASIIKSLNDFEAAFKVAKPSELAKSVVGMPTDLNTKYNTAALLAKGETLFNLGVLNGPDLEIIRRTLADPSTFFGAATSPETVTEQVKTVKGIIETGLQNYRKQYGGSAAGLPAELPPASGGWSIKPKAP